ncbi:MYXO-CTERM domain-containing protein [Thermolongibacillus altinsuensis]|jgi:MYXO-CTERM domain-containing protein|uniref:MYXO-CTERM domain-containing protein n=1 Tax=Thermolongibacillus altinsuensis TaxID=575256 RepID=A0A4R1QCT1_9BACL|nr:WGxxGxxG family protein [Thermolongibacillus altinsuensis]TCL48749.1 MYXO-CTERM domain-containing protein [Thermolongibacillus altinsuensis]
MKKKLSFILCTLALTVMSLGMSVHAEDNRPMTRNVTTATDTNDNDTNWEWIGLLGLAGLFGLRGRREREAR